MRLAFITAGGAGMFCGSCMQDNSLTQALRTSGVDAVLLPTYTPIRVDEADASENQVHLGGLNIYLDSRLPGWNRMPRWFRGTLDRPGVVRWLSYLARGNEAASLGKLTVEMLSGDDGPQRRQFQDFAAFIADELKPDVVLFSNALLSGVLPAFRSRFSGGIGCILQGDDIFLNALPPRWRDQSLELLRSNLEAVNVFLVHSRYYGEYMRELLGVPEARMQKVPLTMSFESCPSAELIETGHLGGLRTNETERLTVGYFARICIEKGAELLIDAFEQLAAESTIRLVMGGYVRRGDQRWWTKLRRRAERLLGDRFVWAGSPESRAEKMDILQSFDLLCVPSPYREPKGLYVLEAAACGVPSLVPRHGAFPELIESLGCGWLHQPDSAGDIANRIREFARDSAADTSGGKRVATAALLSRNVRTHFGAATTGPVVRDVLAAIGNQQNPPV